MNRLQKKCLIASAATHGLLLVLLFVGPAFFAPSDKIDPAQLLTVIAGPISDDLPSKSVGDSTPHPAPPPTAQVAPPVAPPATPPQPQPPQPQPPQQHVEIPRPQSVPKPTPVPPKPQPEFVEVKPKTPTPNPFTPVTRPTSKPADQKKPVDPKPTQVADNRSALSAAILTRLGKLNSSLAENNSSQISTANGDTGEAVSNYRDIVFSIYTAAWQPPERLTDPSATVTVRVTIARDGHVIRHQITTPSGNSVMDNSIENTLDKVTFVAEFPPSSRDAERSYLIKFNLSAKRSLNDL